LDNFKEHQCLQKTGLDLYPINYDEFLGGIGKLRLAETLCTQVFKEPLPEIAYVQLWDLWKNYLVIGALPEAINCYRMHLGSLGSIPLPSFLKRDHQIP
jgi:hypothetical protein